jgi:MFS family permease
VVLGGLLVGITGAYRALFVVDAISFLVLFAVVYWAIAESHQVANTHGAVSGWQQALRDRRLLTYALANVLFTTYLVQINSTMPLYFTNFLAGLPGGFSPPTLSALFTWHMIVSVLCQLPAARVLNRFSRAWGLTLSAVLWGVGFLLVWVTGVVSSHHLLWATIALGVLALATVTYMPSASSISVELAPESLRGVYLAVNSQCWAIGSFIGPPLGGWALDQSPFVAHSFWLGLALSVGVTILILQRLDRMMKLSKP